MSISNYTFFFEHVSFNVSLFIIMGLLFALFAAYIFIRFSNKKWVYFLLFIGVSILSSGFALIPPFLNLWDEQFHALVAKNMMQNPFKPYLLGPDFDQNYKSWTTNHIWLHKQPLFLWQITASLKMFGVNLFALRLPSVLLHAASSVLVLSISKRYLSPFLAILVTFLFAFSEFQLSLLSGVLGMDHNDIAFLFYCTASFWAWIKYSETKKFKYVLLIGIFSGGAILCKWLVGMIVYAGWGMVILITQLKELKEWNNLIKAFLITLIIIMPWQIYCYIQFSQEFLHEMNYNSLHFVKVLENHSGDVFYHFDAMKSIYGNGLLVSILIWAGIIAMIIKGFVLKSRLHIFSSTIFCIVYIFFTLAKTKILAYTLVVSSIGFVALVFIFQVLMEYIKSKKRSFTFRIPIVFQPIIILFILMLHFQIKIVIDRNHLKGNNKIYELRELKTKYILSEIKNSNHQNYFIKNEGTMSLVVNASFYTRVKIYPYYPNCEKLGKVIDVNGIGEN